MHGYTTPKALVIFIADSSFTDQSNFFRAVYEYVHTVQTALWGPWPTWLMGGGAVFVEC